MAIGGNSLRAGSFGDDTNETLSVIYFKGFKVPNSKPCRVRGANSVDEPESYGFQD